MSALAYRLIKPNIENLQEQMSLCSGVQGKLQEVVLNFLVNREIYSLDSVSLNLIAEFREYIKKIEVSINKRRSYSSLLEQVTLSYLDDGCSEIRKQVEEVSAERAVKNKVTLFLMLNGISSAGEITYDIRKKYSNYVEETVSSTKITEYIKILDQLRLNSTKRDNIEFPLKERVFKYKNDKFFLLYHPDYELAMTFYYIRDKEELLFDFSIETSGLLKRQILKMLNYVLEEKTNWHDRRERFIVPLKLLYMFCVDNGIEDIEQLTEKEIKDFKNSIDGKYGTKTDTYMQIVENIRKYLFLSAQTINWNANVWFLERFRFEEGRDNPARLINTFSFSEIQDTDNRTLFKQFMKYHLGVSQKVSLQTLRTIYYGIVAFLKDLDKKHIKANQINGEQLEKYIKELDLKGNQPETFNVAVISVARFYGYLLIRKEISSIPIHFNYYLKKTFQRHNNRSVSVEVQFEILKALKEFPHHLRLMYLILWCVGLRISEVCSLKGSAFSWDGKDAWIHVYQNKMKQEKKDPIPKTLYLLVSEYIGENHIGSNDFIFKNKNGGAYDAGTFSKQVKKYLLLAGITEYDFKAHDFRHTVASYLFTNGASIEVIRDYLGHKDSNMTKKYLDFMSDIIDNENEEYFKKSENKLIDIKNRIKKNGK